MRAAAIFIYLCFFLLAGNNSIHGVPAARAAQYAATAWLASTDIDSRGHAVVTNEDTSPGLAYLVAGDAEDEDTEDGLGKCKSPLSHCSALSFRPVLSDRLACATAPLSAGNRASCKYILQRVLRI